VGTRLPLDPRIWLTTGDGARITNPLAGTGDPWTGGQVDEPPALLAGQPPRYPEALRAAGRAGRVIIQAVIDTIGHAEPGSVIVVESPDSGFDDPARSYVLTAQFRPGRVRGRPVRVLVRVPIEFALSRSW
jgi:protein TonB